MLDWQTSASGRQNISTTIPQCWRGGGIRRPHTVITAFLYFLEMSWRSLVSVRPYSKEQHHILHLFCDWLMQKHLWNCISLTASVFQQALKKKKSLAKHALDSSFLFPSSLHSCESQFKSHDETTLAITIQISYVTLSAGLFVLLHLYSLLLLSVYSRHCVLGCLLLHSAFLSMALSVSLILIHYIKTLINIDLSWIWIKSLYYICTLRTMKLSAQLLGYKIKKRNTKKRHTQKKNNTHIVYDHLKCNRWELRVWRFWWPGSAMSLMIICA